MQGYLLRAVAKKSGAALVAWFRTSTLAAAAHFLFGGTPPSLSPLLPSGGTLATELILRSCCCKHGAASRGWTGCKHNSQLLAQRAASRARARVVSRGGAKNQLASAEVWVTLSGSGLPGDGEATARRHMQRTHDGGDLSSTPTCYGSKAAVHACSTVRPCNLQTTPQPTCVALIDTALNWAILGLLSLVGAGLHGTAPSRRD